MTRIQRLFRHHIRTPSNPSGRIRREVCFFEHRVKTGKAVPSSGKCWYSDRKDNERVAEAHHIDYAHPFKVVWLCFHHHRKLERGKVKLRKRMVWDYTSLIDGIAKFGNRVSKEEVPF